MKVLIAGGGQVGALVARRLVREGNAVTIIDLDPDRCRQLEAQRGQHHSESAAGHGRPGCSGGCCRGRPAT